jgi:putative FmdB family regulatory protein
MPNYEFECKTCGHPFSRVMTMDEHDNKKVRCPKCGSDDVKHVIESVFVTASMDAARNLIDEPGPFQPHELKGRLPGTS